MRRIVGKFVPLNTSFCENVEFLSVPISDAPTQVLGRSDFLRGGRNRDRTHLSREQLEIDVAFNRHRRTLTVSVTANSKTTFVNGEEVKFMTVLNDQDVLWFKGKKPPQKKDIYPKYRFVVLPSPVAMRKPVPVQNEQATRDKPTRQVRPPGGGGQPRDRIRPPSASATTRPVGVAGRGRVSGVSLPIHGKRNAVSNPPKTILGNVNRKNNLQTPCNSQHQAVKRRRPGDGDQDKEQASGFQSRKRRKTVQIPNPVVMNRTGPPTRIMSLVNLPQASEYTRLKGLLGDELDCSVCRKAVASMRFLPCQCKVCSTCAMTLQKTSQSRQIFCRVCKVQVVKVKRDNFNSMLRPLHDVIATTDQRPSMEGPSIGNGDELRFIKEVVENPEFRYCNFESSVMKCCKCGPNSTCCHVVCDLCNTVPIVLDNSKDNFCRSCERYFCAASYCRMDPIKEMLKYTFDTFPRANPNDERSLKYSLNQVERMILLKYLQQKKLTVNKFWSDVLSFLDQNELSHPTRPGLKSDSKVCRECAAESLMVLAFQYRRSSISNDFHLSRREKCTYGRECNLQWRDSAVGHLLRYDHCCEKLQNRHRMPNRIERTPQAPTLPKKVKSPEIIIIDD